MKMDLLQDYLVSQGLCEVTPWGGFVVEWVTSFLNLEVT
jgi:hypothetical protein